MQQEIDLAEDARRVLHDRGNITVVTNIERHQELHLVGILFRALGHPPPILALGIVGSVRQVTEPTHAPFAHNELGDRPGNGPIVSDPQDEALLAVKLTHASLPSQRPACGRAYPRLCPECPTVC